MTTGCIYTLCHGIMLVFLFKTLVMVTSRQFQWELSLKLMHQDFSKSSSSRVALGSKSVESCCIICFLDPGIVAAAQHDRAKVYMSDCDPPCHNTARPSCWTEKKATVCTQTAGKDVGFLALLRLLGAGVRVRKIMTLDQEK